MSKKEFDHNIDMIKETLQPLPKGSPTEIAPLSKLTHVVISLYSLGVVPRNVEDGVLLFWTFLKHFFPILEWLPSYRLWPISRSNPPLCLYKDNVYTISMPLANLETLHPSVGATGATIS